MLYQPFETTRTRIFTSLIGVKDHRRFFSFAQRFFKHLKNKCGRVMKADLPPDDLPGIAIDDGGKIDRPSIILNFSVADCQRHKWTPRWGLCSDHERDDALD